MVFCLIPAACLVVRASGAIELACKGMPEGEAVGNMLRLELLASCSAQKAVLKMMVGEKPLRSAIFPALLPLMHPNKVEYHEAAAPLLATFGQQAELIAKLPPQCEHLEGPARHAHAILAVHFKQASTQLLVPCGDPNSDVKGLNFHNYALKPQDLALILGTLEGDIFEVDALDLRNTNLSNESAAELVKALQYNFSLKRLICGADLNVAMISEGSSLNLSSMNLSSSDIILACGLMARREKEGEEGILDLQGNPLVDDAVAPAVAEVIKKRPQMVKVDLSGTGVQRMGMDIIVAAVDGHASMQTVVFGQKDTGITMDVQGNVGAGAGITMDVHGNVGVGAGITMDVQGNVGVGAGITMDVQGNVGSGAGAGAGITMDVQGKLRPWP